MVNPPEIMRRSRGENDDMTVDRFLVVSTGKREITWCT